MPTVRPEVQAPAVFDIEGAARAGDGKGQGSGRKAAGAEEEGEDEWMVEGEAEAGGEAQEVIPARQVDYFA